MAKVLLVGTATDGPSYQVKLFSGDDVALYGGNYVQRQYLSPSASSVTLEYTPWKTPTNKVNYVNSWLYSPIVSGSTLLFGTIGGSGNQLVDLTYTPYIAYSDLIASAKKFQADTGTAPYVVRIGGEKASLVVGDWIFKSKYGGVKYNKVYISYTGSGFTVSGLEPNYPALSYTGDVHNFPAWLDSKFRLGSSPIYVETFTDTLSPFSSYMSGGSDGTINSSTLDNLINYGFFPTEVTHVCIPAEATSDYIIKIADFIADPTGQPRIYFLNSPMVTSPASTWVDTMATQIPYRSSQIVLVAGEVTTTIEGKQVTRYGAEAAAIAISKSLNDNLTNLPLSVDSFTPTLQESDLELLITNGFVPLMRYIKNDISTYRGVNSLGDISNYSFIYHSKVAEIISLARTYCFRYIGQLIPQGVNSLMQRDITQILSTIAFVKITNVSVIVKGEDMFVGIEGIVSNEILNISFVVKNK